jgi:hypothetical protein
MDHKRNLRHNPDRKVYPWEYDVETVGEVSSRARGIMATVADTMSVGWENRVFKDDGTVVPLDLCTLSSLSKEEKRAYYKRCGKAAIASQEKKAKAGEVPREPVIKSAEDFFPRGEADEWWTPPQNSGSKSNSGLPRDNEAAPSAPIGHGNGSRRPAQLMGIGRGQPLPRN